MDASWALEASRLIVRSESWVGLLVMNMLLKPRLSPGDGRQVPRGLLPSDRAPLLSGSSSGAETPFVPQGCASSMLDDISLLSNIPEPLLFFIVHQEIKGL